MLPLISAISLSQEEKEILGVLKLAKRYNVALAANYTSFDSSTLAYTAKTLLALRLQMELV